MSLEKSILTEEGEISRTMPSKEETPQEILIHKEIQQAIQGAIDSLGDKPRSVIILHDVEGFSYEEMAEILNCSIGTIKSRLHRAREILRDKLKNLIVDEYYHFIKK